MRGRPRQPAVARAILAATVQVVAEQGYDGATVDAIVERAGSSKAALYRRWRTKLELVVAALEPLRDRALAQELPDTGSVRGDLIAATTTCGPQRADLHVRLIAGLASAATREPRLAAALDDALIEPAAARVRTALQREADREGLTAAEDDLRAVAVPLLVARSAQMDRRAVDERLVAELVDQVLRPMSCAEVSGTAKGVQSTRRLARPT